MARADRLAQRDLVDHAGREREGAGAQAVDRLGVLVEGSPSSSGSSSPSRVGEHEEAARELAGAQPQVVRAVSGPGSASSTSVPTTAATSSHSRSETTSGSARSAAAAGMAA